MSTIASIPVEFSRFRAVQGTITADAPAYYSTATWNNAGVTFTHLFANVTDSASNAASLLIDLQVGGSSKFKVTKAGAGTFAAGITATTGTFSGAVGMTALTATTGGFSDDVTITGATKSLVLATAGGGIKIKEGTNATVGTGTLSGGTATINTTKVTANSRIFLTWQDTATVAGNALWVSSRVAGTSFTVTDNGGSSKAFVWMIVEPA